MGLQIYRYSNTNNSNSNEKNYSNDLSFLRMITCCCNPVIISQCCTNIFGMNFCYSLIGKPNKRDTYTV